MVFTIQLRSLAEIAHNLITETRFSIRIIDIVIKKGLTQIQIRLKTKLID
jgi:hypothetical protein